jgi:hypothetical protein
MQSYQNHDNIDEDDDTVLMLDYKPKQYTVNKALAMDGFTKTVMNLNNLMGPAM